jgi:hypothetical protein
MRVRRDVVCPLESCVAYSLLMLARRPS